MEKDFSLKELEAMLADRKKQQRQERVTYKNLVGETVQELMPKLIKMSQQMAELKKEVYDSFDTIVKMKSELYNVDEKQLTHTFRNYTTGDVIIIGYNKKEGYDDTVSAGMEKVKRYLDTLARNEESAQQFRIIMSLLSKDDKGDLKASRITELKNAALESGDADFIEGVEIIEQAYQPQRTCTFVKVLTRDENGKEKGVPLSMSSVD